MEFVKNFNFYKSTLKGMPCKCKYGMMSLMLLSSKYEELRSVEWFYGLKGKIRVKFTEMCDVFGEDCMDINNISRWCAFFKVAIPYMWVR